ncbi:hypothetical protein N9114_05530 [Akkermansiaceae bacterium]|nr:hypothetical protein [Akkermansiaceae bacterium]MDB4587192.1 hypothetical protein [Akkermansiaceae bacterium]
MKFDHFFGWEMWDIWNMTVWRRKSDDKQKKWLFRKRTSKNFIEEFHWTWRVG